MFRWQHFHGCCSSLALPTVADNLLSKNHSRLGATVKTSSRGLMREGFEVNKTPKRSVVVNGKKTSISIEQEFWEAFRTIATSKQIGLSDLASEIAIGHGDQPNVSSGIRVFVLNYYQRLAGK